MGWLIYVIAGLFVLAGVLMLRYPNISRHLDERRNSRSGLRSDFRSDYDNGLKMRAAFVIGIGVVLALVPLIAP